MQKDYDYNLSLIAQRDALLLRERLLKAGTPEDSADRAAWGELRALSQGKLAPVVVRKIVHGSEHTFAAYLIGPTVNKGSRLLLKTDPWRIVWVKKGTRIQHVRGHVAKSLHAAAVARHCEMNKLLDSIIGKKSTWRPTEQKKASSNGAARRRQAVRSS